MLCMFVVVQKYLQIPTFHFYRCSACSLLFRRVVVKLSSVARLAPPWSSQLYLPPYSPDLKSIEEASGRVTYGVRNREGVAAGADEASCPILWVEGEVEPVRYRATFFPELQRGRVFLVTQP